MVVVVVVSVMCWCGGCQVPVLVLHVVVGVVVVVVCGGEISSAGCCCGNGLH